MSLQYELEIPATLIKNGTKSAMSAVKLKNFNYLNDPANPSHANDFTLRMQQEQIVNHPELYQFLQQDFITKLAVYNNQASYNLMQEKVPQISHMIYLFKEGTTKMLSLDNTAKVVISTTRLNDLHTGWKHYFWTNNPNNIPDAVKNCANLEIKDYLEFADHKLFPKLNSMLSDANSSNDYIPILTSASDILRLLAVQRYGGLYHDVDYHIIRADYIDRLTKEFSLVLTQEDDETQIDSANYFIAAKPSHSVINDAVDMVYRNFHQDTPDYVKHPKDKINKLVFETGPCVLTAALYKHVALVKQNIVENDFMFFLSGGIANYPLAKSFTYAPHDPPISCRNNNDTAVVDIKNYHGIDIVTAGADLLCGSWTSGKDFANPINYYQLQDYDGNLECGTWNIYPVHLTPVDYTLELDGEILACGINKYE
jgi:hypothetical protein